MAAASQRASTTQGGVDATTATTTASSSTFLSSSHLVSSTTRALLEHDGSAADDAPLHGAVLSRYVLDTSFESRRAAEGRTRAPAAAAALRSGGSASPDSVRVCRCKVILLGHQEVGKTSLRKCLESEPLFFRRLPDVRATTGVEVQQKLVNVHGASVELQLADFAGQESYHSHSYFLARRAVYVLVWKVSAVEQDYQGGGINASEEERLYTWLAEVYAKYPRATIVLVATHLDELRVQGQRSVEMILTRVEHKMRAFLARIALPHDDDGQRDASDDRAAAAAATTSTAQAAATTTTPRACHIAASFAVSCKTRQIIAAGAALRSLSGGRISALAKYLAQLASVECARDADYADARVPRSHMRLVREVEQTKRERPQRLLMPLSELAHLAAAHGIVDTRRDSSSSNGNNKDNNDNGDDEGATLLRVACLMHDWDVLYVLHRHRLEDNLFFVLQPRWLARVAAALFSYAHVLHTPLHLRSMIGGLEYTISHAEAADLSLLRRGYVRWPLARVVFAQPLTDVLRRAPDDTDVALCLQLLQAMQLLYPVRVACDDAAVVHEETPVGRHDVRDRSAATTTTPHNNNNNDNDNDSHRSVATAAAEASTVVRYFVPSLAPLPVPVVLKQLAPLLLRGSARLQLEFSLLPDELWWRLQCMMHTHTRAITVYQPPGAAAAAAAAAATQTTRASGGGGATATTTVVDDDDEDDALAEELLLLGTTRLREADEEHSRWSDAMWLSAPSCRVFAYREGITGIALYTAETTPGAAAALLQTLETAVQELLVEYAGVRRVLLVACPNAHCDGGWLDASVVASSVRVTCSVCRQTFDSDTVILGSHNNGNNNNNNNNGDAHAADAATRQPPSRRFAEELLVKLGELLSSCLTHRSCVYMCRYLGIPYRGPAPSPSPSSQQHDDAAVRADGDGANTATATSDEPHVEYLHALDKVVQAALFRAWLQRSAEAARRRRMLDVAPLPAYA